MKTHGCSALFYAVYRNSAEALQVHFEFYAGPGVYLCSNILLLAFPTLHEKHGPTNTTGVMEQLLVRGTNPHVIPKDTWTEYWNDPKHMSSKLLIDAAD